MPLTKLQFRPGVNRETTSYTNEGGWFDGDKVRFRFGLPEKIGGWLKQTTNSFLGTARALKPWVALDGTSFIGVGTHLKYYVSEGGGYNDITPIRLTTSAGDVTFATKANTLSSAVTVDDTTMPVTSSTGFPVSGRIKIDDEIMTYSGVSGNNLTGCVRAQDSTTVAAHDSGATVSCATLTVTDSGHGANVNDFVTYSGAATLGGLITANVLNQEYEITNIVDSNTYQVEARTVSTISSITTTSGLDATYVFCNTSDSGNGGSSVVGKYQIVTGLDTVVSGTGWGAGLWGADGWGSASALTDVGSTLRIWSHDNFGEDLLINVRDGGIYYWDKSATDAMTTPAVALGDIAGANAAPTIAKIIKVSDRDRHVIAFGCDPSSSLIQDPLLIRFSSIESVTDWLPTATNDAGSLKLGTGSEIVSAIETRQQILVFTDVSLHAMQYLGPPFTFGINLISQNITIMGPLSAIAVDDNVFWMGAEEFYVYNGSVQRLPCTVRDYIFNDFNQSQAEKVTAGINSSFGEVWWFYPSASAVEIDSYVIYNYQQQVWYYGKMTRTVWVDRGINTFPIASGTDHYLYNHELGLDDGSTEPVSSISSYIESSQLDIGEGDRFSFISKLIPDLTFRDSTADSPSATFTLESRNYPGGAYLQSNDKTVTRSEAATATVVEQFTDQVNLRLRGRSFAVKIASGDSGVTWRLGSPRVDVRPDGRR
jgi:hypothetical protein